MSTLASAANRIRQADGFPRHLETIEIEGYGEQLIPARVDQVTGEHIAACIAALDNEGAFPGVEALHLNMALVLAGAREHGEHHRPATRQHMRPAMAHFALGAVQTGHLGRSASVGRHHGQAGTGGRREINRAVRRPAPAPAVGGVAQRLRDACGEATFFSFPCAKNPIH